MKPKGCVMRIFITGGTGFVGKALSRRLAEGGHDVTVLTRTLRREQDLPDRITLREGDPTEPGSWQDLVPDHNAAINLAGASIFTRWTDKNKARIRNSRIRTTQNLVDALRKKAGKKNLLLSTSAVGYYGPHGDETLDEKTGPGDDFLASVTRDWETSALAASDYGVRVVLCRFGIVLGQRGGALQKMLPPFRRYLGSPLGSGKQWFSWIHIKDLIEIYPFLLEHEGISGPLNMTAPHPVRNKVLTRALGQVLKKPTFMPAVPGFLLKMAMGEFGSVLLEGQKVAPKKLLDADFPFRFPRIQDALEDLLT